MSSAEVRAALDAFPDCGRLLMVGVLVSEKTLAGKPNKYPLRYPRRENIAGVFVDDPRCLNLVHYATESRLGTGAEIIEAMRAGGPLCHGVQLNTRWPETWRLEQALVAGLEVFREVFSAARLVVQLRPDGSPASEIAARACYVAARGRGATDVLIDSSGGLGTSLDPRRAREFVDAIELGKKAFGYELGVGIAGGLCAETLPEIADLVRAGVSTDAEGRLRDDATGGGNLVPYKVQAHLAGHATILGEPR